MFELHISRAARDRYGFDDVLFSTDGAAIFANLPAAREFARRINQVRNSAAHPELAVHAGSLNAMGLIDEALHLVLAQYREQRDSSAITDALAFLERRLGRQALDRLLLEFATQFPSVAVYRGAQSPAEWMEGATGATPHRAVALEEAFFLWLANANPAFRRHQELFDDSELARATAYPRLSELLRAYFETRPRFGPEDQNVFDLLRAPALASPNSLSGQLEFIRRKWPPLLGDFITRLAIAAGVLQEEEVAIWMQFHPPAAGAPFGGGATGDSSAAAIPHFEAAAEHEYEAFSADIEWMPRTVMIAKSAYVWLHQLSRRYSCGIHRLDEVPDEELDSFSRRGFNAVWIIGVWQRSRASQRIKQLTGNPEAGASAYSLYDYAIADDLGGEAAYRNLRDRAAARGIRLASDMVPNHMGIDSRWLIEHPEWFIQLDHPPFPAYTFNGPDVSSDGRVEIRVEDHYYDRTDAAVVFLRRDRWTGDTRFIYHGNDGTSFPWNDTAQLNYLNPQVREAVIQAILHVARQFPIIRFDAAMTLTRKHYQRLWFPEPGSGSAIASRAEHGLTRARFDAAMPQEFWREVVDRVAVEAPGTLLLAEAFWLLEGYFVRTLGMHRVYNSAFMNMLRDEENANYRSVMKNTLEFDPEVLKRYVNFMSNPDERTAIDQFGKGDKYFGCCVLMATMPGLPMFGHGQLEGFHERYGMEYRRSYFEEAPDEWLVARHEREITPLLHRRWLFAEVANFLLYDFYTDAGQVNEDVFAYSNQAGGDRALVIYNNRYAETRGWIRMSASYAGKGEHGRQLRQRSLGEAFGLRGEAHCFIACRDAVTGLEHLHRSSELAEKGMRLELGAYRYHVFLEWRELQGERWGPLCERLQGRGASSLEDELRMLELEPVHSALASMAEASLLERLAGETAESRDCSAKDFLDADVAPHAVEEAVSRLHRFLEEVRQVEGGRVDAATEQRTAWLFSARLRAAQRLPAIEEEFSTPWPEAARGVLPAGPAGALSGIAPWAMVVAWAAAEAACTALPELPGADLTSGDRDRGRPQEKFDRLRLRHAIALALESCGLAGEERWRAAAMVRAALARHSASPIAGDDLLAWVRDPEIAWLLGLHEYEGVRYMVRERFEVFIWWLHLPSLLSLAGDAGRNGKEIRALERHIAARFASAEQASYRLDSLLEAAPVEEPQTSAEPATSQPQAKK
ncbi:MAG: alpha-amylase [Acidobacteria bacterium]|nr:alpha-amylase [Acidobacteriota bacterium]